MESACFEGQSKAHSLEELGGVCRGSPGVLGGKSTAGRQEERPGRGCEVFQGNSHGPMQSEWNLGDRDEAGQTGS